MSAPEVTEPDDLFDTALAKAEEIAGNPTNAVMMIKELLAKNPMDPDLEAVMLKALEKEEKDRHEDIMKQIRDMDKIPKEHGEHQVLARQLRDPLYQYYDLLQSASIASQKPDRMQ